MPDVYSLINQPAFLKAKNKTKEICAKFISLTYVFLRYLLFSILNLFCVCLYHVWFMSCLLHKWQICISPAKIMIMSHNLHYYAKMILSFMFLVTTTQCPLNTKHMGRSHKRWAIGPLNSPQEVLDKLYLK